MALLALAAAIALPASLRPAQAEALLLVEVDSGKVLHSENATYPWYPASVTKLMTLYVALQAVRERRITLDQLLAVSANAAAQAPSKMGFKPGTQVTVDNAIKMLMVKSANDMAVVLAEGISGSIENFATEMNRAAQRLGMTQSTFVNPNGLPADLQVSSARDLAILGRALIREFPAYDHYLNIPAIRFGRRVMRNYNRLIDRYPGADGMKTGFICASGFNLVASATRGGKRLIAVVLGAQSSAQRAERAAALLEQGFNRGALAWLMPALGTIDRLTPIAAAPPNLRDQMCGKNRRRPAAESDDDETAEADSDAAYASLNAAFDLRIPKSGSLVGPLVASRPPIPVFVGPAKQPTKLAARPGNEQYQTASEPAAGSASGSGGKARGSARPAVTSAVQGATAAGADKASRATPMPRPRPQAKASARGRTRR